MVYTSNVPQASQAIATTQPIIQANFGFLAASIGQEHNFNASGTGTDTYHKFCSMPNRSGGDPVALPAGTNGQFYVVNSTAKFYNTTQVGGNLLGAVNMQINFSGGGTAGNLAGGGGSGNLINGSFNVNTATSTKDSTGVYTIRFTNPLPSVTGAVLITGMRKTSTSAKECFGFIQGAAAIGSSFTTSLITVAFQTSGGNPVDVIMGSVIIFGC